MKPKLFIQPARFAPAVMLPEEPKRPLKKTRIFDGNGTEFVGVAEVTTRLDPELARTVVTVTMHLQPGEALRIETAPESLEDRLRALAAKWNQYTQAYSADRDGGIADAVRETCAQELDAVLDRWPLTPEAAGV